MMGEELGEDQWSLWLFSYIAAITLLTSASWGRIIPRMDTASPK
jgi:hypothetical protein